MKILNTFFKKRSLIICGIIPFLLFSCFDSDEVDFDKQLEEDLTTIDQYLSDHSIVPLNDSTKQIRYIIHQSGSGEIPQLDSCITANFAGKLLEDGFTFTSGTGYAFPMSGDIIEGWKLIIPLLHEGDFVTFYIPSGLAYGPSGIPDENIPPNANVLFNFELLHVGKTYSQSPSPAGSCD